MSDTPKKRVTYSMIGGTNSPQEVHVMLDTKHLQAISDSVEKLAARPVSTNSSAKEVQVTLMHHRLLLLLVYGLFTLCGTSFLVIVLLAFQTIQTIDWSLLWNQ